MPKYRPRGNRLKKRARQQARAAAVALQTAIIELPKAGKTTIAESAAA
ncbi:MAG: hypothetical protein AB7I38_18630 [Dehalococcoidia bacterium]